MSANRTKILEEYYRQDPQDPFNIYALALEYLGTDRNKSVTLFETLLAQHKDYLPTYYHAARLYSDLGEKEKAVAVFTSGIALAKKLNDQKALRELQSAYDELMFE